MRQLVLACFALLAATRMQAQRAQDRFTGNSDTVFIRGHVSKPFFLTTGTAASLLHATVPPHPLTSPRGDTLHALGAGKGILLRDLLEQAAVADIPHKERGNYLVVVTAADGLQVVFAYNELLYAPAAAGAYLFLADGVSGMEGAGHFTVLCTSDRATAPCYVKWVRSIDLRKI